MLGFKNKNSAEQKYVVVQEIPGTDQPVYTGPAHDRDAAMRIFAGVLQSAPEGFFNPYTGNRIKVVPAVKS